ncbi:hypothetical protein L6307_06475 [Candidatus Parcubacteria bacterium]|nr:hypothetical protein [Candidatus Parcubacteria bacterium]
MSYPLNDESNNTKTLGCGLKTQKHSASPQNTKTLGFASKHKNTNI